MRFMNSDDGLYKPHNILSTNLYAYCSNTVVCTVDSNGNDAYWITDTDGAGGMGHTSLLLEDDDGKWYYFYWGMTDNLNEYVGVKILMEEVENLPFKQNGMLDVDGFNAKLARMGIDGKRDYECASLYTGDYSASVSYAFLLKKTYVDSNLKYYPAYNLVIANCMQTSATVMQASHPLILDPIGWLQFEGLKYYVHPNLVKEIVDLGRHSEYKTE